MTSRSRLRRSTAVAALAVAALSACSASPTDPVSLNGGEAQHLASGNFRAADADLTQTLKVDYTGTAQQFQVPDGVDTLVVDMVGGAGFGYYDRPATDDSPKADNLWGGRGLRITGDIKVTPGHTLTLGAGGRGGQANGNTDPGTGGWGVTPQYSGGHGSGGSGADARDGNGGGGASAILDGETPLVVAGGGGGQGGAAKATNYAWSGGDAGDTAAKDGNKYGKNTGGRGASSSLTTLNKIGTSGKSGTISGGGGGGGGGAYTGEGGDKSFNNGGGGGGGTSFTTNVQSKTIALGANAQNGYIHLTWVDSLATANYSLHAADARSDQVIQVAGAKADDGAAALTGEYGLDGDNTRPRQVWTFTRDGDSGSTGTLINKATGKCLEVNGSDGSIDQWTCQDGANQRWELVGATAGGTTLMVSLKVDTGSWDAGDYFLTADATGPRSVLDGTKLTLTTTETTTSRWNVVSED